MSKWYIVNLIAHEKTLVEISDGEDENSKPLGDVATRKETKWKK